MKKQFSLLALACLLGCGPSTPDGQPDAIPSVLSAEALRAAPNVALVSRPSNLCLDVEGGKNVVQAKLQIFGCHGKPNQGFLFTAAKELRVFDAAICVEPSDKSSKSSTQLAINTCDGSTIQKWTLNSSGTITNQQTGQCIDVQGRKTQEKTPVESVVCNGQSNQLWYVPTPDSVDPSIPTKPLVSQLTCDSLIFSWTAATDNVGVAFYDIYHDGQFMKTVPGSVTSTELALVPGAKWGLYVNARDAAGNVSQASPTVDIAPPLCQEDPEPPTRPTNLQGILSGNTVTLTWNASTDNVAVTSYVIFRNGSKAGSIPGTSKAPPSTTFIDSALAAGSYRYEVQAQDAQGNVSSSSPALSIKVSQPCTQGVCSVQELTQEKDVPWGLVTLPDGSILYARRDAQDIVRLDPKSGEKTVVGKVPNVQGTDGEGGLMGLEIAPTFPQDRWLYIMHTSPKDNRIVRIKISAANTLDIPSAQILLQGLKRNKFHNGGRLRWGPDNKLYVSTGDAQNGAYAQNIDVLEGKVLRLNPDGSVPSDNPFPKNYVWSYGHRNPQGLAFDSKGRLWEQEFGDSTMDETNLINKGGNYGWPNCEGTLSRQGTGCATPGYIAPKKTYSNADASCSGIAIVKDVLYVACARGARMYREVISGTELTNVQQFFVGTYGRLRTVEPTPDGNIWLTTSNDGDKDSIPNNSNNRLLKVFLSQ